MSVGVSSLRLRALRIRLEYLQKRLERNQYPSERKFSFDIREANALAWAIQQLDGNRPVTDLHTVTHCKDSVLRRLKDLNTSPDLIEQVRDTFDRISSSVDLARHYAVVLDDEECDDKS